MSGDGLAMGRVQALFEKVQQWTFARRVGLQSYMAQHFVRDAHRWNIHCQKVLVLPPSALATSHATLAADIPERFRSAVGDVCQSFNDMINAHLGEVREIDGSWVRHNGRMPTPESHLTLFHEQFCLSRSEFLAVKGRGKGNGKPTYIRPSDEGNDDPEGRVNTILKPALGGDSSSSGAVYFYVRVCRIISLAELFWFFGTEFTGRELYQYYVRARRLVLTRQHAWTSAARREMVVAHHAATGRWGMGDTPVGEHVWRGSRRHGFQ